MTSPGSVTSCIGLLKQGDPDAAGVLWRRNYQRLVGLARQRLGGVPRRATDEEDVALSALDSFCRGAMGGRFPRLEDRDDLWHLLGVITARKASDLARREGAQKRGRGGAEPRPDLDQLIAPGLTPALAAQVAEQCRRLLESLDDEVFRAVALGKLEGRTNDEIAAQIGRDRRTVERKLRRIRAAWREELER